MADKTLIKFTELLTLSVHFGVQPSMGPGPRDAIELHSLPPSAIVGAVKEVKYIAAAKLL